jgi:glucosamine--fructose-6-phosphate aminotransferase (isomerizing)
VNDYLKDVVSQHDDLKAALNYYFNEENLAKISAITKMTFGHVIFTGMGSSHYCSHSASIYLSVMGINSRVISCAELLHYESCLVKKDTLVIVISQSGESAEIKKLIEKLGDVKIIGITNDVLSSLGKRADIVFNLNLPPEKAVSTRTYISSVVLCLLISYGIAGKLKPEIKKVFIGTIDEIKNALRVCEENEDKLKAFLEGASYITLLARGYNIGTVYAGALFIQELSKFPSYSMDSAEFRHGPMEIVDDKFRGIVIAPSGLTHDLNIKLAREMAKYGGKVILITDNPEGITEEGIITIKMDSCDEPLTPIFYILPIQYLNNLLAEQRSLKVGTFRWGAKITTKE